MKNKRHAKILEIIQSTNTVTQSDLTEKLRECGFGGNCITVCYEPVTGSHVGPGTVALFFPGTHK